MRCRRACARRVSWAHARHTSSAARERWPVLTHAEPHQRGRRAARPQRLRARLPTTACQVRTMRASAGAPRPRSILQRTPDIVADGTLARLGSSQLSSIADALAERLRRGRRWSLSLEARVVVVATSLQTNLTLRELAIVFSISTSQVHRILVDLVPRLAALFRTPTTHDR